MHRLANVRRMLYATLPWDYRVRVAMVDILSMNTSWFRKAINDALTEEFVRAGVTLKADIDFFQIIHRAVLKRVSPRDDGYDDLFQEVAMGFLDRKRSEIPKQWAAQVKRLQDMGKDTNIAGFLATSANNFVQDIHDKSRRYNNRHDQITAPKNDDDAGGIDIDRVDIGAPNHTDNVSAEEIYNLLMNELKDDRSKKILKLIVDKGIDGFLQGKGLTEMTKEFGATSPSMMTYYRDKIFKPDLLRVLRNMNDPELIERARQVFATTARPPAAILVAEIGKVLAYTQGG